MKENLIQGRLAWKNEKKDEVVFIPDFKGTIYITKDFKCFK